MQLVAGNTGNVARPMPAMARRDMLMAQEAAAVGKAVGEQTVGDVHLYTLPGPQTILPGQATAVALFEPLNVAFEKNYVVSGYIPYWGYLPQQPEEGEVPVEVSYLIKRPLDSEFGDRPLPGGIARVYQPDSAGQLQLIGEAGLDHTAPGEDLRLSTGTAFDLTARRIQTAYITRRDSTRSGWRTRAEATFRVTIANATDSARVVDVHERRGLRRLGEELRGAGRHQRGQGQAHLQVQHGRAVRRRHGRHGLLDAGSGVRLQVHQRLVLRHRPHL